jgi:hypothetical protein
MSVGNGEDYDIYPVTSAEGQALKHIVSRLTTLILDQSENIGRIIAAHARLDVQVREIAAQVSDLHSRHSDMRRELQTVPDADDIKAAARTEIQLDKGSDAQRVLEAQSKLRGTILAGVIVAIIIGVLGFVAGKIVH